MNSDIGNERPAPEEANGATDQTGGSGTEHACAADEDADEIGASILQNEELVQLILESEKNMSPPMTLEEFRAWLFRR